MVRFVILRALSLLLAVNTVSSSPLADEHFSPWGNSPSNGLVWPSVLDDQIHGESWPEFANKTERRPSYRAPTFEELKFMSSKNMSWLARSGGHGFSPTLQSTQDAVLVNLENVSQVQFQSDSTVVVGTGVYFGDLINAVGAAGRELTVGTCHCVGATGAILDGGLDCLQGLYGLTSDALHMIFAKSSIEKVVEITNNLLVPALDEKLSLMSLLTLNATTSELYMAVNIVYSGPEEGQKYTQLLSPYSLGLQEHMLKWEELPTKTLFGYVPLFCTSGPRYNLYTTNVRTLDSPIWVEFSNESEKFMQQHPTVNASLIIETYPVQGIEALSEDYSAFPHRRYFHNVIEVIGLYTDDSVAKSVDDFLRFWRDKFAATSRYDELHVYQNYAHYDEPLSALYGNQHWRHERLTKLKNDYDPHGFFNRYHAVPFDVEKWT
ncbi:hypothetical protein N7517_000063 [Penicillium concentricum]|uniref:FAD-binding PCMH-type domain-containing protein n=1 Tax=Penicillium concentricum TaxID=293559 RepID=A0A9W9VHJ0_9EURO|nr:uncharacterized protein N7517_000063 [Penicillium concentricum]KAJ5382152.1 hypothetical protein N7517_000063 [Penicillium concentricum]